MIYIRSLLAMCYRTYSKNSVNMNGLTLGGCLLKEQSGDEISLTFIGYVFIQSLVTRTE